jgi:hypothetical protein
MTALPDATPRGPMPVRRPGIDDYPRRFRLRGKAHKAALLSHILASIAWFGMAVAIAVALVTAEATDDDALADGLRRSLEVSHWLTIPVGLAAVATGVLMSLATVWGLFRHWWVVAKIAFAVAVIVTDATVVRTATADAVRTAGDSSPAWGPVIAHVVLLGLASVLSVFKPRGRTPWTRPPRPAGAVATVSPRS